MRKNIIWRTIPYTKGIYQISSEGVVRKILTSFSNINTYKYKGSLYEDLNYSICEDKIENLSFNYYSVKIKRKNKEEEIAISSLMYEAFHGIIGIKNNEILHLDGNEFNNSLKNLILCKSEHKKEYHFILKSSHYTSINTFSSNNNEMKLLKNGRVICVSVYNNKGELKNIYSDIVETSKKCKVSTDEIKRCLYGIKKLNSTFLIFKLGIGPKKIDTSLIAKSLIVSNNSVGILNLKMVLKYNLKGNLLHVYNNAVEASLQNNINFDMFRKVQKRPTIINNNIWEFYN
jgi:hypothetical protein